MVPPVSAPQFLTYAEVEATYGISKPTLYSMVSRRQIPHYRIGRRFVRFRASELDEWFERRRVAVTPEVPQDR